MPATIRSIHVLFWTPNLALAALAVLAGGAAHYRRGERPAGWLPAARACPGAGMFILLTPRFCWDWHTASCIRFLPVLAGAVLPLSPIWLPSPSRRAASYVARAALIAGLAGALFWRWAPLDDLAPGILDALFGVWLSPWDLRLVPDGRELATACLELFAQAALLLWLFQHLWGRFMSRGKNGRGELEAARPPLKRRCTG